MGQNHSSRFHFVLRRLSKNILSRRERKTTAYAFTLFKEQLWNEITIVSFADALWQSCLMSAYLHTLEKNVSNQFICFRKPINKSWPYHYQLPSILNMNP